LQSQHFMMADSARAVEIARKALRLADPQVLSYPQDQRAGCGAVALEPAV
jgi:hypothetical protein